MKRTQIYGMMAEFDTPDSIVHAARLTHQAGYRRIDAYSPFPIEALAEAIDFHPTDVPLVVLVGGIIGGLSGFFLIIFSSDPKYEPAETRRFLEGLNPRSIAEVPS